MPAMVHVSSSCNANFHATGAHYINADTTAFMQLIQGDLFKDFPTLRLIIPHGGGAVPYHWGRYRGLAQDMKRPPLDTHVMKNVFFDTCVYHQPGIDLLLKVIPVENILFGSEMVGAVRGIDPTTGFNYDDTKRYIECVVTVAGRQEAHLRGERVPGVSAAEGPARRHLISARRFRAEARWRARSVRRAASAARRGRHPARPPPRGCGGTPAAASRSRRWPEPAGR